MTSHKIAIFPKEFQYFWRLVLRILHLFNENQLFTASIAGRSPRRPATVVSAKSGPKSYDLEALGHCFSTTWKPRLFQASASPSSAHEQLRAAQGQLRVARSCPGAANDFAFLSHV